MLFLFFFKYCDLFYLITAVNLIISIILVAYMHKIVFNLGISLFALLASLAKYVLREASRKRVKKP